MRPSFASIGLVCCFTGCSAAPHSIVADASGADAVLDTTLAASIRVMVYNEDLPGAPVANARVVFVAPDHSSQTVLTGVDGVAQAISPQGTTVTAIQDFSAGKQFTSFRAVQPGMFLISGPPDQMTHVVGQANVEMPLLSDGMYYEVRAPCRTSISGASQPMRVDVVSPCAPESAATLVGTVRNADHAILGVSILDGVDLVSAVNGATIMMPPYTQMPVSLTVDLANVPATIDHLTWFDYFKQRSEHVLDSFDAAEYLAYGAEMSMQTGTVVLSSAGYIAGDESLFTLVLHHAGYDSAFTNFASTVSPSATHFGVDVSDMTIGFDVTATASQDQITWTETSDGGAPTLLDAAVAWENTYGTIYAPYDGSSLSLDDLPGELASVETPTLVSLASFTADGLDYDALASLMRERARFWEDDWASAMPDHPAFWISVFHGSY